MLTLLDIQYFNKGFKIETHRFNRQQKKNIQQQSKTSKALNKAKKYRSLGRGGTIYLYCLLTCLATVCSYAVRRALSPFFASGGLSRGGGGEHIYIYVYVYIWICIYVYPLRDHIE